MFYTLSHWFSFSVVALPLCGFCFCFGLEILITITHLGLFIQTDSSGFEVKIQVIQGKFVIQQGNADTLKQKFIKSFKAAASI